jgi:hypothetical protein
MLCVGPHVLPWQDEGKEVSQKHYHPEVVLLTNSQRIQLRWLLHATVVQWVLLICG